VDIAVLYKAPSAAAALSGGLACATSRSAPSTLPCLARCTVSGD